MKIVLIGSCGSGKSTLASKLYTALKERRLNAELVPELIRYEINTNGPMRSIWEQYRTRQAQKDIEDAIPAAVDYTIVDSGTLTPYFYATQYADHQDARERLVMQDMFRYLLDDIYLKRYDFIFYLRPILDANLQDGTRYQSEAERDALAEHMELVFNRLYRPGNIFVIDGPVENRLDRVLDVLGQHSAINDLTDANIGEISAQFDTFVDGFNDLLQSLSDEDDHCGDHLGDHLGDHWIDHNAVTITSDIVQYLNSPRCPDRY